MAGVGRGVKDSLQGSVPGGAGGEVMLKHKKLPSQSQTQRRLKRSSSTFFLLAHMRRPQLPEGRGLAEVMASWRQRWTQAASKMAGCLLSQSRQRQSPPRGSKRSYSRLGLPVDEPEEAGPWCPVARQVQPPPSLGPPFRWRGPLQAGPTGLAPGAAPP